MSVPKEILNRLRDETPVFWKRVRNYAALLAIISGGAVTAIATSGLSVPIWITFALSFLATISGSVAGTAQFTKIEDKEE